MTLAVRSPLVPLWRLAFLAATVLLVGCTSVQLVSGYDEQSDRELTSLYADTSAFVDRMIALRGTPEGSYAANQLFYADAGGRVDALIARAEANQLLGNCPSLALVRKALASAPVPAAAEAGLDSLAGSDCQVGLYRLLRANYAEMANAHRGAGPAGLLPFMRDQFITGGVGSTLRSAMRVQIAKKIASEQGGQ